MRPYSPARTARLTLSAPPPEEDVTQVQSRALALAPQLAPLIEVDGESVAASVDAVAAAAYDLQFTEPEVAVGLHGLATVLNAARFLKSVNFLFACRMLFMSLF